MKSLLMSKPMLEAWVAGRKAVTRRPERGLAEINKEPGMWRFMGFDDSLPAFEHWGHPRYIHAKPCYQVGETVYIPEVWRQWEGQVEYKASQEWTGLHMEDANPWRSPRAMPARAARHFAQVVDVKPERLILPLDSKELALEGGIAALPYLQSVEGLWVFRYQTEPTKRPEGVETRAYEGERQ